MMKKILFVVIAVVIAAYSYAQVGVAINSTGAFADTSAILDISSTTQGILIPRMTTAERNAIALPANGLMIFNTTSACFEAYVNGGWHTASCPATCNAPATPGSITGNSNECENETGVSYSIADVPFATTYAWSVPNGATVTSGQGTSSINVDFGTNSGDICVIASNQCGSSAGNCKAVTIEPVPVSPVEGTHDPDVDQIIWNWNAVTGASGYKWNTVNDYGSATDLGNNTTKTETGLSCATGYTRYVWAYNNCDYSSSTALTATTDACLIWTQYASGTYSVGSPTNLSGITYHGIVNTDQLVITHVYSKATDDVVYYIRGVVLDLTTGAMNVGSEYSFGNKPTGYIYRCGVAGDGNKGVAISNVPSGAVELNGFNITNYSSCNQSVAPVYSFAGNIQHYPNNNNGGGVGADIVSARANNRYVAVSRSSADRQEVRSYIYNGVTITAEGAVNEVSNSNGTATSLNYFANPGGGLNWGLHITNSDHNGNSIITSKAGSGGYDASNGAFYSVGKSSVFFGSAPFNDAPGACKSVIVGGCSNDAYLTARIVATTDFTSGALSYGTEYTSSANFGMKKVLPYDGTKVFLFTTSGVNFLAYPINISGSTLSWGASEIISTNSVWSGYSGGAGFTVYNGGDTWFVHCAANNSTAKIIAVKYTP